MESRMKLFPLIFIGYGPQKLFSYEKNGINYLPLFTDPNRSQKYVVNMTEFINLNNDDRQLSSHTCDDIKTVINLIQTVKLFFKVDKVVINPLPADDHYENTLIIEQSYTIDQFLELLIDQM